MKNFIRQIVRSAGIAAVVLGISACATTEQVPHVRMSGFLKDYSKLHKGKPGQAEFNYRKPGADLSAYSKVILDPVQLWAADGEDSALGRLSREDQQMLVNYLHIALRDALIRDYVLVEQAGPDVMRIRCAITEARADKPVADLLSTLTPAGLGISYAKRLVLGTHSAVGVVSVEGELLDSLSGERLGAVVDRRAGTKSLLGKPTRWGDVQDAFSFWARRMQTNLAVLRENRV
jgi:hypothetical protein